MILVWVRHGETEANTQGRYLGQTDSPLTRRGLRQAEAAARRIAGLAGISRVYSSDLARCVETAAAISRSAGQPYILDARLREVSFGSWEGTTYEELMASSDREAAVRWYEDPYANRPPGGESVSELGERVEAFLDRAASETKRGGIVVAVSHGGPIRYFQARYLRGDEAGFWRADGIGHGEALTAERTEDGWRVVPLERA